MAHDYMGFDETLEEDDYGIIVGKDGIIKGIWVPRHLENMENIPNSIANMCNLYFGVDPNDELCYHTVH
jgi:hypothetical protein